MIYSEVEDLVAARSIGGALDHVAATGDDSDRQTWMPFLESAAFAVDRQQCPSERRLSLRQLAYDDEDADVSSQARAHARLTWPPALHLLDGTFQRRTSEAAVFTGHSRDIRHLAITDRGWIVTASRDGVIRSLDPASGALQCELELAELRGLLHITGSLVAAAHRDGTVSLVDCELGVVNRRLGAQGGSPVSAIARFGHQMLATGHVNGQVRIHDLATGRECVSTHHDAAVRVIVVAGDLVAVGGFDGSISLWDERAQVVETLNGHLHPIRSMSSAGATLCSADDGGVIFVWDLDSRRAHARNLGPTRGVHHVLLVAGPRVIVADFDGTLRALDTTSGAELARRRSHTARVRACVPLADGELLTASDDRTLRTWDVEELRETGSRRGHLGWVRDAAELPDGRIVSVSVDKTVRVWPKTPAGTEHTGHDGWIRDLVDCRNDHVASASEDGTVRLWDLNDGSCVGASHATTSIARCLASDGAIVAAGCDDGSLVLWRLDAAELLERRVVACAHDRVRAVASLDGDLLVTAGADGWLRVWEYESLRCIAESHDVDGGGWRTLARLDASTVAAGNEKGDVVLWTPSTSTSRRLRGHRGRIWAMTAVDERRLATVSFDKTARLWDVEAGTEVMCVGEPLGASWGISVITESLIAAASPIGVVRVARTDDLSVVARADLRSAAVSVTASVRSDGQHCIVVGGDDPHPLVLVMEPESLSGAKRDRRLQANQLNTTKEHRHVRAVVRP